MTNTPTVQNKSPIDSDIVDWPTREHERDNIQMILHILHTPILSLLEEYLSRSNWDLRKTTQKCMSEYKDKHYVLFFLSFMCDLIFQLFAIGIVMAVLLRWLWVIHF